MFVVTLLVGIACGEAGKVAPDQCSYPHSAVTVVQNPTRRQVETELVNCERALPILRGQIQARGQQDKALVYCDQRVVGGLMP